MARTVTVGLDASPESRAAAEWAAREAALRDLPLKIVHVWEPVPEPMALAPPLGGESRQQWTEEVPRQAAEGLRLRHPGVEVITDRFTGNPAQALTEAADGAELMVLGSRGLGGIAGFMLGSVGLAVLAHAERPVVLVRAWEQAADEHKPDPAGIPSAATPFRPVVLGLDLGTPDETLLGFAFDAAARRGASLRVVHGWSRPPASFHRPSGAAGLYDELAHAQARALSELLRAWRLKFPDVEVIEASRCGSAAQVLVDASREACLVVVGRRVRTSPLGAHIGHVTHAVLHHVVAPVAVVPHD
ncbi:nucleotide-binding universal stress UspA family protein [Streptomyces puniciscabiei]|uniref:Nucleotide-binding universal stress UspA family protein n=1 Tax=Streptomyces puniciscabiei TaxID=164348 RepID=A0A542THY7_9ACTN|nr:universal stress protein [Streptomyces puniciscabiei]TQK86446.1 nucleotide-binding universal stress UspA family protein [Streptomyces puniciscabiei]